MKGQINYVGMNVNIQLATVDIATAVQKLNHSLQNLIAVSDTNPESSNERLAYCSAITELESSMYDVSKATSIVWKKVMEDASKAIQIEHDYRIECAEQDAIEYGQDELVVDHEKGEYTFMGITGKWIDATK